VIRGTAEKLEVVRPADAASHVGRASPLGDAIARAQAKATLVRLGWKAGIARAAIDRSPSHTKPTSPMDAISQARSALVNMGWTASIARVAIDRAAAEISADATVEFIVRVALKHCPSPLHTQMRARDGTVPTWGVWIQARLAG
jgi:Holliday junction resolvasome RuvABC DNA-binding subunit